MAMQQTSNMSDIWSETEFEHVLATFRPYLQSGKELICILVLPQVQALAVIILEGIPEGPRHIVVLIGQCQIGKHGLHQGMFKSVDKHIGRSVGRRPAPSSGC